MNHNESITDTWKKIKSQTTINAQFHRIIIFNFDLYRNPCSLSIEISKRHNKKFQHDKYNVIYTNTLCFPSLYPLQAGNNFAFVVVSLP